MAKLSLKVNPTFTAKVGIPCAGGEDAEVMLTFKHRTKTALAEFANSRAEKTDVQSFMDMVEGWDLSDALTEANVAELLENYIGAAVATYRTYVQELTKAREKN